MSNKPNNNQASHAVGEGGAIRAEATSDSFLEMTESCARDLTERINTGAEDLAGMLKRAHDEKAWAALGYESWQAYTLAEIKLSKSRIFQLLDYEEIRQELKESTMVDSSSLNERAARALKKVEPSKRPEVFANAVKLADGEPPTAKQVAAAAEGVPPAAAGPQSTPGTGVIDQASRHWSIAKKYLDKISKEDVSRESVLREALAYVKGRLKGQE